MKNQFSPRWNRKPQHLLVGVTFLSLFTLSAAIFTACDKETPLSVDKQSQPENPSDVTVKNIDMQKAKYSYQGKLYDGEEFQRIFKDKEFPVMALGMGSPDEDVVYVFDSEADFKVWMQTTPFADKIVEMEKQIAEARQQAKSAPSSKMSIGKTLSRGGSAILNDAFDFKGNWFPFVPLPATNVVPYVGDGFNDRARSAKVYNFLGTTVCALYEHINYGGLQLIIINSRTNHRTEISNLGVFSNMISSMIVL